MERQKLGHPSHTLECEVDVEDLLAAQSAVREVTITDEIKRYIVDLVEGTRGHDEIYLGASPRGSLALFRTSQALAASLGRDYVIPDDVKRMAIPTLAHRLVLASAARIQEIDARDIIRELTRKIPVPGGEGL